MRFRRAGRQPIHAYGGIEHTQHGPFGECLLCRIEALSATIAVEREMRARREFAIARESWQAAVGVELRGDEEDFRRWYAEAGDLTIAPTPDSFDDAVRGIGARGRDRV